MKTNNKPNTAAGVLQDFMNENGMNQTEFGEWLGVSGSCVGAWLKTGEIPAYAARAIKLAGEVRQARASAAAARRSAENPPKILAVVFKGPAETIDLLKKFADRTDVETLDLDL